MKKICVFIRDPLYMGGAENYTKALVSILLKKYELLFITKYGAIGLEGKTKRRYLPGKLFEAFSWSYETACDLIISGTYDSIIPSLLYAIKQKTPLILILHDLVTSKSHGIEAFRQLNIIEKITNIFRERILLPVFSRLAKTIIITPNPQLARLAEEITSVPSFAIPPGLPKCNPNTPVINRSERHIDLIYVGRLVPHKRVDLALGAIYILKQRGVRLKFVVSGDGPLKDRLMLLAKKLNINDLVTFTGYVSEEEKNKLLNNSKFFINLSSMEGFGIATLEAMCHGAVPILRGRDYPERWIAGESAYYCREPCNIESTADVILTALTGRWEDKSRMAIKRARRFLLLNSQKKFLYLVQKLIE